ncbi:MAG: tetratricopeptide repeat protein [Bacteroidia bacterium]
MIQRYFFVLLTMVGMTVSLTAQTKLSAAGDAKRDKGDFAGALTEYSAQIDKIDAEVQNIIKIRQGYEKMSEYDKALQDQDVVKTAKTDYANLYYGRAMCNIGLGKKNVATPDLDAAIWLDPSLADAYYQRGMIVSSPTTRDQACMDISKAASLGHTKAKVAYDDNFCWNQAQTHYKEGASKLNVRKYDEAIAELNLAIALSPDSGRYYSKRGQAYQGLGKNAKAIEDFSKAIEVDPKNADGYYQMGMYYFNQDKHELAFDYLTKAIDRNPSNYDAYMYRAQCCERLMKMTSAIYDYGQAISLRPNDSEAFYRRGLVERDMKNKTDACKDFSRAAALGNPDAAEYLKTECGR